MIKNNITEKTNGTLRVIIGLLSFFCSGLMLLVVWSLATRNIMGGSEKTLVKAISDEPIIFFILLFLLTLLIASIFSFISGLFSLGIRQENINKKLKWDLYFWISFSLIALPVLLGFIYAILNY